MVVIDRSVLVLILYVVVEQYLCINLLLHGFPQIPGPTTGAAGIDWC